MAYQGHQQQHGGYYDQYSSQQQQPYYGAPSSSSSYYPPPPSSHLPPEVASDPNAFRDWFRYQLSQLSFNSKPIITHLTMVANEVGVRWGNLVAQALDDHLRSCPAPARLPALYLLDSISKNIGSPYLHLFSRFLERSFLLAYGSADSSTRTKLEELLGTWRTGGRDGGELFGRSEFGGGGGGGTEGRGGRGVQQGIEFALWGHLGRGGGSATGGRGAGSAYAAGAASSQAPPSSSSSLAPSPDSPAPPSEIASVLEDVRRLLHLRQLEHPHPVEGSNMARQIAALMQLERLVSQTPLNGTQIVQIRSQLAALGPTLPPPPPMPTVMMPPPPLPLPQGVDLAALLAGVQQQQQPPPPPPPPTTAPQPQEGVVNPLAGISPAVLAQLAQSLLASNSPSSFPPPPPPQQQQQQQQQQQGPTREEMEERQREEEIKRARKAYEALVEGAVAMELSSGEIAKERPHATYRILYDQFPLQCAQCGLRLLSTSASDAIMGSHLDGHFRAKKRARDALGTGRSAGRAWFVGEREWRESVDEVGEGAEGVKMEDGFGAKTTGKEEVKEGLSGEEKERLRKFKVAAPTGQQQGTEDGERIKCPVCQEAFKAEWSDEDEDWVFWNAELVDGTYIHAICHAERQAAEALHAAEAEAEAATLLAAKKEEAEDDDDVLSMQLATTADQSRVATPALPPAGGGAGLLAGIAIPDSVRRALMGMKAATPEPASDDEDVNDGESKQSNSTRKRVKSQEEEAAAAGNSALKKVKMEDNTTTSSVMDSDAETTYHDAE